jgi:hypothetical protein
MIGRMVTGHWFICWSWLTIAVIPPRGLFEMRNRSAEDYAFHKWLCSEESAKVEVIVHCGAEILLHFVHQNDRLVSSLMVDWFIS